MSTPEWGYKYHINRVIRIFKDWMSLTTYPVYDPNRAVMGKDQTKKTSILEKNGRLPSGLPLMRYVVMHEGYTYSFDDKPAMITWLKGFNKENWEQEYYIYSYVGHKTWSKKTIYEEGDLIDEKTEEDRD